jgi:hypothetical protein
MQKKQVFCANASGRISSHKLERNDGAVSTTAKAGLESTKKAEQTNPAF